MTSPLLSFIRCFDDFSFVPFWISDSSTDRFCPAFFEDCFDDDAITGGPGGGGGGRGAELIVECSKSQTQKRQYSCWPKMDKNIYTLSK